MKQMKNYSLASDIYTCIADESNQEINDPYMKIFFLPLPVVFIEINRQKFVEVPLVYSQDYIFSLLERIHFKKNENSLMASPNRQALTENANITIGS